LIAKKCLIPLSNIKLKVSANRKINKQALYSQSHYSEQSQANIQTYVQYSYVRLTGRQTGRKTHRNTAGIGKYSLDKYTVERKIYRQTDK
jgi:hypothetical protein